MPTQQRFRANKERPPARFPQDPAGRSKEDTVGVLETRTSDLAAKNRKLVSEHDDLELLEFTRPQTQRHHREPTPKQQIDQRHKQEQDSLHPMRARPDSTATKPTATRALSQQTNLRTPQARAAALAN